MPSLRRPFIPYSVGELFRVLFSSRVLRLSFGLVTYGVHEVVVFLFWCVVLIRRCFLRRVSSDPPGIRQVRINLRGSGGLHLPNVRTDEQGLLRGHRKRAWAGRHAGRRLGWLQVAGEKRVNSIRYVDWMLL